MCCDGTLFLHASLNRGEKGNLPEKIEQNTFSESEKDYFRLPCLYFEGICSIYNKKRTNICSSYRCQLLKDFAVNKITKAAALKIVKDASAIRDDIFREYNNLSGRWEVLCFKRLPGELIKSVDFGSLSLPVIEKYNLLLGKCNILEALLIKYIRSEGDFDDLMDENSS